MVAGVKPPFAVPALLGQGAKMDVTTKELSDILSLTQRRIQDLENEGVITKIGRNKWDLKECVQSYIEYKIAKRYEHLRTNRS
jgi:hypothetical protein